jgi:hypothetical protein
MAIIAGSFVFWTLRSPMGITFEPEERTSTRNDNPAGSNIDDKISILNDKISILNDKISILNDKIDYATKNK